MIEGPSGLMALAPEGSRPRYEVSRRRVAWPNGAEGYAFSAEDAASLRGPQFDAAWCDEIAAWRQAVETWDMLAFAMRLGAHPRIVATTTPRPTPLVKRLAMLGAKSAGGVAMTHAATDANADFLAPGFIEALDEAYAGTRLARQEREGVLIEDAAGAMWVRAMIEPYRIKPEDAPSMDRIVVAVDPPASAGGDSDACGLVAAGRAGKRYYVLADATRRGLRPLEWARAAIALATSVGAAEIVAESNQGGEMVREVLRLAGADEAGLRITLVHASASKLSRAEPVSTLYDQGLAAHAGVFGDLEDQMCAFGAKEQRGSPDRVDALVWAVTTLMKPRAPPSVDLL
jgi:phage terminase large subunit-like protein